MEQLNFDQAHDTGKPGKDSLSAYVRQMETEGNLRKLAAKLKTELDEPFGNEEQDMPEQGPDLTFSEFEKKRQQRDDQ